MDTCNRNDKEMNIVIVGHVDHGKSTVIGRLLADTDSLPKGKLEQIKELCRRTAKPFEYAFLLDALKDERSQGITIDTARCFFKTEKRKYIIIDAPGHIEFLKNMITGASRAQAALLVIDAAEGIQENSRRHGYMLSMLGIKQITVLVNKLDLIDEDKRESTYNSIVDEYCAFLNEIGVHPSHYIPVSAAKGWNIAHRSEAVSWYNGCTVLEALDDFEELPEADNLPARMWVQDVYKFTNENDDRRIIAGTVSSGVIGVGDRVMFLPSGKKTKIKSVETFNSPPKSSSSAGMASGFCMDEQIYIKRGELMVKIGEDSPTLGTTFEASVFWLGRDNLTVNKNYKLKIGSCSVNCVVSKIISVLDASTLTNTVRNEVFRHEVCRCIVRCERPVAFDIGGKTEDTGRFVIVDDYEISGGGIITASVDGDTSEKLIRRNIKWIKSDVTKIERRDFYFQSACLIIVSGPAGDECKKKFSRNTERILLEQGKVAYYLGLGNVLYGVDADIKTVDSLYSAPERSEHIRRLGEISNIMLDAGNILVVTAAELTDDEIDLLRNTVSGEKTITVWCGKTSDMTGTYEFVSNNEQPTEKLIDAITE